MSPATTFLSPSPTTHPLFRAESAVFLTRRFVPLPLSHSDAPRHPAHLKLPALHQMGWHRLVSWPNGCLFKHWGCLHCCGSLHVKHSPLKPYANPIKVSAVQCGEAIRRCSQVCLRSSRKANLIEQLKGKSDSAQHHVEDTRLHGSQVCGGQREINEGPEGARAPRSGAQSQPVRNPGSCLCGDTRQSGLFGSLYLPSFLFLIPRGILIYFLMTNCHPS